MTDEEVLEAAQWAYRAGLAEGELQIARKVIEAARVLQSNTVKPSEEDTAWSTLREALEEYDRTRR